MILARILRGFLPTGIIFLMLLFSPLRADDSMVLVQRLAALTSLQADFVWLVQDTAQSGYSQRRGKLYFQRPYQLRWEVEAPFPQLIVSDGINIHQFDPDLQQAIIQPLDTRPDWVPLLLIASDTETITQSYRVNFDSTQDIFYLYPKDASSLFTRLQLYFRDNFVTGMRMEDSSNRYTEISFKNVAINSPLPVDLFVFVPPPGVDVLQGVENSIVVQ